MADPIGSSYWKDFEPFVDFFRDWAGSGEDFQSTSNDSNDSSEVIHKAKRVKRNSIYDSANEKTLSVVPASTRKLLAILQRLKSESEMKLYAYVNYDKYDSLVYLPHSVARCYTSANVYAYEKLLQRHYSNRCTTTFAERLTIQKPNRRPIMLTITRETDVTPRECLGIFALSRDSHPDCVCNILSTQVVDNQIHAIMMYSYTDIPDMYAPTGNTTNHPFMRVPQAGNRSTLLAKYLQLSTCPPSVQFQLRALFDSPDKLVFHVKLNVVFTFNLHGTVHKVTDVQVTALQTSIEHNNIVYSLP